MWGRLVIILLGSVGLIQAVEPTLLPKKDLQPFIEKNCLKCHGPEKQKGQVRLDEISWEIGDNDTAQRWQDMLDVLNAGEMPPSEEEQPADEELIQVLSQLTTHLQEARKRLTARSGATQMRRLNRREYAATIKGLFGFEMNLYDIPEDGETDTFDTVGTEHLFSSAHLKKYHSLGKMISEQALNYNTKPHRPTTKERQEPEKKVTSKLRKKVEDADRKMAIKEGGGGWQEMGFKDEGAMKILFSQWKSRVEQPRRYLDYPLVGHGVYISDVAKTASSARHTDPRGEYVIRLKAGVHDPEGNLDEIRRIIRIGDKSRIYGTRKLEGTTTDPQVVEMRAQSKLGKSLLSAIISENIPQGNTNSIRSYVQKLAGTRDRTDPQAAVWIDWIEIEGPYYSDRRPLFEDLLFPDMPTGASKNLLHKDTNVRALIEGFAYQAFRRQQPSPEYVDALHTYYQQQVQERVKPKEALVEVMAVVLSSPSFLYIQENEGEGGLSNRELAVRLSYFLWSSPPDDTLYGADLSNPEVYEAQVDRLLQDPRSKSFRDGFISQWAEFDRYDSISVDQRKYFRFNEGLQQDAKQEVLEFFGVMIEENLPADTLIDSDYLMLNGALAAHYEIPFPKAQDGAVGEFIKVAIPEDSVRGGLLTQTAFLVAGSNGERSSPVIRGSLILEKFLHDKPAPPPPNVPELGVEGGGPRSNRELTELHQKKPSCASCHRKIDPVGFGLENFDPTGRWRDVERVGRKKKELPIDMRGHLPTGEKFQTLHEFRQSLLTQRAALATELTTSLLSYGLGRTIEFSDEPVINEILAKTKSNNYQVRDLIKQVAMSTLFKSH